MATELKAAARRAKPPAPSPPPIGGLLAFDLLHWGVFAGVVGVAALPLAWIGSRVPMPWGVLLLGPMVPVFLALVLAQAALLRRLAPRLQPGAHPFPGSRQGVAWTWTLVLQRVVFHPWWGRLLMGSAVLRYLALRALGARVAFRAMMSSDVVHLDAGLLEVGSGTLMGAEVLTAGHLIKGGRLILAPVRVEQGAEVHAFSKLGPGVVVGAGAIVGPASKLGPRVRIGPGARLGVGCVLRSDIEVGAGARLGDGCLVGAGARVGEGVVVPPGTVLLAGAGVRPGDDHP